LKKGIPERALDGIKFSSASLKQTADVKTRAERGIFRDRQHRYPPTLGSAEDGERWRKQKSAAFRADWLVLSRDTSSKA
jgi:hypothetical protein